MPSWSDRLLPAALRHDTTVLPLARLTVQLSTVLAGAALAYAVFYGAVVGFRAGAVILVAGAAVAVVALGLLHVRPWLRALGHLLTCAVYGVLTGLVCYSGGLASPIMGWLMMPPVFAILLFGRRGAVGWTALCVATIAAFLAADLGGVRFPVGYPDEWAKRLTMASYVGLVTCTAILLLVFEGIRAGAQARAESASAALARLAYHDALTGLANRAGFLDVLDAALTQAYEAGDPARVGVLIIDLDGFKAVNDSMGHATGDALLAQVAARLLNATRGCDTVARLGGDEFAVLLDGVRMDGDTCVVAQRIVTSIAAPFAIQGREVRVGASVGVARAAAMPEADAQSTDAGAAVLHNADVAMYRAKALGGGYLLWSRIDQHPLPPRPPAERPETSLGFGDAQFGVA